MRKNAIFIIFLTMIFMLTGCAAPHVGAEPESGKDVVVLESGHASKNGQTIVTLKPRPTPEPTPEVTPEPTAEPTPEPETTEEMPQESLAPNESAESSLNQPVTETADHSGGQKYCYLTFDDGPSKNTEAILKILNDKGIQATFFVVGKNAAEHPDRVKAIAAQGSLVANHTQTHDTSVIYQDEESCLKAFDDGRDTIASILGSDYPNDLVRFPYGSTNRRCRDYRDAVKNAGYRFFDWNALNGDAESGASKRTSDDLYQELKDTVDKQYKKGNDIIVLMHDTNSKTNTVKMLPDAIDYIRSLGYTFETLEHKPMS